MVHVGKYTIHGSYGIDLAFVLLSFVMTIWLGWLMFFVDSEVFLRPRGSGFTDS